MTSRDVVSLTNTDHPFSVHGQGLNCCTSGCGATEQQKPIGRPGEVLTPNLLAGVKQWNQFAGRDVHGIEAIRLAPIAVKTGQGQIFER